jgi:DNA-binding MarR family transcriptional regulator
MAGRELRQELGKRDPFEVPEQEAMLNLLRTNDLLQIQFTRLFREHALSAPQYNILRILRGVGGDGLPSLEIASRMVTCVPDITRLIDRLESSGLAKRDRCDPDRRVVRVRITDDGMAILERLDGPVIDLHKKLIGHLSHEELAELSRLLVKARTPG